MRTDDAFDASHDCHAPLPHTDHCQERVGHLAQRQRHCRALHTLDARVLVSRYTDFTYVVSFNEAAIQKSIEHTDTGTVLS